MSSTPSPRDQPVVSLRITTPGSSSTMRIPVNTPLSAIGNVRWEPRINNYVHVIRIGLIRQSDDAQFPLIDATIVQRSAGAFTWQALVPTSETGAFLIRATAFDQLEEPLDSEDRPIQIV